MTRKKHDKQAPHPPKRITRLKLFENLKGGHMRPTKRQVEEDKKHIALQNEIELLRRKYKTLVKERNAQDRLVEHAKTAISALSPIPFPKYVGTKGEQRESAVLVGSCWHIGETISKDEMGGLNEYNFDIFVRRYQYLIEKTIHNAKKFPVDELHVFLTGDMVSGVIHDEIESTNQLNIVEQATLGALVTAQGIQELAGVFSKVIITGVVGNHGRTRHQKYFKHKQQVNWDYVFYTTLALLLKKQKNVSVHIPMSFWTIVEVQGWKFLVMHGDLVKSWGGIPFYGISREVAKWVKIQSSQRNFFHYFVASHFHTKAVLQTPMGEDILNGSLKGGDEYAVGLGFHNDPVQLLFGVHPKYGKSWEMSLNTKHANGTLRYHYDRTKNLSEQEI